MNEELDYAEMLEIPVETVTFNRKERKRHERESDLKDRLVQEVNERMEADPQYAESRPIEREAVLDLNKNRKASRIIMAEFVAVCLLCMAIFLTNIFLETSAINTFMRGLFHGNSAPAEADTRVYSDFALSGVVNSTVDAELTVSSTGVLSFVEQCSVYPPCEGKVASVNGNAGSGYTLEIKHSDTFSTIMSGLDAVYLSEGETVHSNLPIGYSNGEKEVRVMFYSDGALLSCIRVDNNTLSWS